MDVERELYDVLNKEITRELLLEINPDISSQEVDEMWALCAGNPYNAPILYRLLQFAK